MKKLFPPRLILIIIAAFIFTAVGAYASGDGEALSIPKVLLALLTVTIAARVGGEVFAALKQPSVLGELIFGIILGNLALVGCNWFDFLKTDYSAKVGIELLAELGVILLLFQVGLESDLGKMMKVGASSLVVATLGVVTPFILGWGVATLLLPHEGFYAHMFIGATLCATSVGITARVLMDLGCIQTPEARIILGAAVIDDVQGLVILAAVTGIIEAANAGGTMQASGILIIVAKAVLFLVAAILIGRWLSQKTFRMAVYMRTGDAILIIALVFCFLFAYLAAIVGLAPIVGAFAAGLILDEVHWKARRRLRGEDNVDSLIKPVASILVPVFFVSMGIQVDLRNFASPSVLVFAAVLTLAAVIGKQVCALGILEKGLNRMSVGLGMIPRGEVGLIFAAIGSKLVFKGQPVVSAATFSAIVIMVVVTTMITPPLLSANFKKHPHKPDPKSPTVEGGIDL
ncbi:MAG: cation:proton antiporter [Abditibacteriota bacterium]|nr:cation:proton antiporter [Abditibacteriota bacterium]